jgi:uncharacterized membrane protein
MDVDLIFVVGIALAAFAIPSFVSAYADRRWPIQAALMLLIGGGAVMFAMQENPESYSVATIDDTILVVLGRYLN